MSSQPVGFCYFPEFLALAEERELIKWMETLAYQRPVLRGHQLKRGLVQFGWRYDAARRRCVPAPPLPADLVALLQKLIPYCPPWVALTQCIVTAYSPGAGIGWHCDARCFGEYIVGVSLGSEATLRFRRD